MLIPYIGITDFTSYWQVKAMNKIFKEHLPRDSKRRLHVGVMMSRKTLHGIPSKWRDAFPSNAVIAGIFSSGEVYNCLHYADYETEGFCLGLGESLKRAILYGGQHINALQLDMVWPHPSQILLGVHASRKNIEVVLQLGSKALDEVHNDPQQLVKKLRGYEAVIHRVLLDKSMGKGLGMDASALLPFARAIREHFPTLGLVAAGGLGPETVHLVEPLVKEFPDVSIDAQGRLRPSGNALDPVDWKMAERSAHSYQENNRGFNAQYESD